MLPVFLSLIIRHGFTFGKKVTGRIDDILDNPVELYAYTYLAVYLMVFFL